ncbi:two-component system, NtrC family, sensor histidine kinase PilS [Syntrophus gentianae]|uniref:histidine kinase n=1 Tax=Syntrophus gentianae TaxID=43775 RepID=A0A1H7ZQE3_9BACT|nr:two-component system, NtrC family, sensor histidine kinase PilS [Syntrophus gentianae]
MNPTEKPTLWEKRYLQRLNGLILSRIVIATILLGIFVFFDLKQTSSHPEIRFHPFYSLILTTYLLSFLYVILLKVFKTYSVSMHLQMTCDVLLITVLVHMTGGVGSIYSSLYPLVIIYTVLFAERKGGFIVATACSLFYGSLLILEFYGMIDRASSSVVPEISRDAGYLYSRICIHALSFFVVAFLASFVIKQEKTARILLAEKESALDRLDMLHRSIIESIDTGILTVNLEGRIQSFNRAAVQITGLSAENVLNRDISSIFSDFYSLLDRFSKAPSAKGPERRMEMRIRNQDHEEQILGCSLSQLKGSRGEHLGEILIFQDLTDIKKIEAAYEKSRRLAFVGEMAAGLAHEIRNPLAAISGSIQMLKKDLKLDPLDERLMKIVLRGKDQLENVMKDFLLLAKPAAGNKEWINLNELIEEILESLLYIPDWTDEIKIEKNLSDAAMLYVNRTEMQHVLWNLIINALQAMPGGGRLSIETRSFIDESGEDFVQLLIGDSGNGISSEDLEKIYQPFFTTKERGTGLGLAIVGRIIENCSGFLAVDSEIGKGTVFRVCLPRSREIQDAALPDMENTRAA